MAKIVPRLHITHKFVAFLLALSVIPLIVAGISADLISRAVIRDEAGAASAALVDTQKQYLDLQLQGIESLIANISTLDALNSVLAATGASGADDQAVTRARISYLLDGYTHLDGLASIDLFTLDGSHFHAGDALAQPGTRADLEEALMKGAMDAGSGIYWTGVQDNLNTGSAVKKVFSAAKMVRRLDPGTLEAQPVALLVASYSLDALNEHFNQLRLPAGTLLTVLDGSGRVVYHPDARLIGSQTGWDFLPALAGEQGALLRDLNGQHSVVSYSRSTSSGWVVVHVFPTSAMIGRTALVRSALLWTLALLSPLVLLAAWGFTRRIQAPVGAVSRGLGRLREDMPDDNPPAEMPGQDEIATLARRYNAFLSRWKEKRAEESTLRESEQRLRSLVENSGDWMWQTGPDGRFTYTSPNVQAILGYAPEELQGRRPAELLAEGQASAFEEAFNRAAAPGAQMTGLEVAFAHKDGSAVVFELNGAPLTGPDGQPGGFGGACRDITERKAAEAALRESEQRLNLAMRGANDGIWDWDLRENKIYYSPRWKTLVGYTNGEISDSPSEWLGRVHPEDLDRLKADLEAHIEGTTERLEIEHRIFHRSGRYRWVMVLGLAERDENGRAVRVAGSLTDISARKSTEERLRHDAMHDPLTNLPNRAYFLDQLRRSMERSRRHSDYMAAVLFMDLDRFKIVNDSLGHQSGDAMLLSISQRLESCLRAGDVVARFGGDEFAVLLEDMNGINDAIMVANRVQKELTLPFVLQGVEVFTSASIGIALVNPSYTLPEDLLRDADTAMYRAKSSGRARYQLFDSEMHARSLALLQMEAELRRAIEREEFELHYQPMVAINGGRITTVEALLRWNHPVRGTVLPREFMSLAEETGLIVPIGMWVLHTALAQLKCWRESGYSELVLAVNASGRQFQDIGFRDQLQSSLQAVGLPGSALQLEITESAAMQDFELTTQTILDLGRMGIRISIDNFGTNYSSLGYLKRYPVSSIKIDQTFIRDVVDDVDDAAITTAIIAIGHVLNLNVIAEGVETQKQLDFLTAQNCDEIQGYILDHPMPAAEFTERLMLGHLLPVSDGEGR